MKAGDYVRHLPTMEKWVLACADEGLVYPCGWPESRANASDCSLYRISTQTEHLAMLNTWAARPNQNDERVRICKRQLEQLQSLVR